MNEKTYTVVGLDGGEYENIEFALLKEWYAAHLLNEESLIFSKETGEWKKLINLFNIAEFNAARNFLAQQLQQNTVPQPMPEMNSAFNSPYPPRQNYNVAKPESSSKWKMILGVSLTVCLLVAGVIGFGGYYFSKIVRNELSKKSSGEGQQKVLTELKKYEIPGTEFVDQASGAKVLLPKDWRMISPDNPLILIHNRKESEAEAKQLNLSETTMLATDKLANKVLLMEIVNFPERIDKAMLFNKSVEIVEKEMVSQSKPGTYKRIAEFTIPMADGLAKKVIFEKVSKYKNPRMAEFGITDTN